jgi:hypothetical protein
MPFGQWMIVPLRVAAEMRRDLFGPLIRRVHRMGPADGVVVERPRRAQIVDAIDQEFRRCQVWAFCG